MPDLAFVNPSTLSIEFPGNPELSVSIPLGARGAQGVPGTGTTFTGMAVPADTTGVFDPDTARAVFKAAAMAQGLDEPTSESFATSAVAQLAGQQPTTLALLIDNASKLISGMGATSYIAILTAMSKEDAGVAATLIGALGLGTASQAASTDFAGASHNHAGVYDPAGTGAAQAAIQKWAQNLLAVSGDGGTLGSPIQMTNAHGMAVVLAGTLGHVALPTSAGGLTVGQKHTIVCSSNYGVNITADLPIRDCDWDLYDPYYFENGVIQVRLISESLGWIVEHDTSFGIHRGTATAKGDLYVATEADMVGKIAAPATRRRILTPNSTTDTGYEWTHPDPRVTPDSGDVVSALSNGYSTTSPIAVNAMQGHAKWLAAGAIDRMGVYHTANGNSTWRLVLYPASVATGKPNGESLLLDAGVVDLSTGATAWNWKTVSYTIPYDGWYWAFAIGVTYTTSPSVHCISYQNHTAAMLGSPTNISSVGRQQVGLTFGLASSAAPATCPASYGAGFGWSGQVPKIHVRYA